ncbi:MAG: HAD family acid phosphatase [Melioribacteraceae bacterium]|nr:MAG: HAD family acid phosphatase [Melioribacteraceae bacterium]
MKKFILIIIPLIFFGCSSTEVVNLDTAKMIVQDYYENGQYDKEVDEIINDAIKELSRQTFPENSLAIFDVDETMLSNYAHTKEIGFGFEWKLWGEWIQRADCEVIPQSRKLYDWLQERGVKIAFLTGRKPYEYEATIKNLSQVGIITYDTLITRTDKTKDMLAEDFKDYERKLLAEKGYNIVVCVGDQWSDLEGSNTGLTVKLPNYLYLID